MNSDLLAAAQGITDTIVAWRRHLHANPELSGREEQTAAFVAARLRELGWQPQERIGETFGLTAILRVGDAPAVALRADMDALPITEETGLPYASRTPGVMHACGHDAHTAMLLGAAQLVAERRAALRRSVKLLFQPAEEMPPGGAKAMIEAGVLDDVDRVFGLHIWSEMPLGTIGTRSGVFMSSTDELELVIRGKGGHAAMPQQCVDPVLVAAQVVTALQSIVSRSIAMTDNAVVSITKVHAGTATNVVPESATLEGTLRTLSEETRTLCQRRIREIVANTCRAFGADASITIRGGYPALVNDAACVERAMQIAREIGVTKDALQQLPPQGGGEDFAYYARHRPAAFLFLGARNESKDCRYPHHHPRFNIDEAALPLGAALLAGLAVRD
jgi:amidohydrolase